MKNLCLDLAYKIKAGLKGGAAGLPAGWAYLIAVFGHKLRGFQLAQQFFNIAANGRVVDFIGLDDAIGVYQKTAAQGLPRAFNHHAERVGEGSGAVCQHGVANLGNAGRGIGPGFVHKGAVGRYGIDFAIELFELLVVIGQIFQLRGAHKGKVRGIEKEDGPVALYICFGNSFQLATVKSLYVERFNRFIDEISHDCILMAKRDAPAEVAATSF